LLRNSFLLWAVHRTTGARQSEYLHGDETLGALPIGDVSCPHYSHIPKPPVMSAQFQAATYTKILRPLNKLVLDQLHALTIVNKRRSWLTIYLTLFILLHSCAMLTRQNEEYARRILLKVSSNRIFLKF
jgi:hypothetical protein